MDEYSLEADGSFESFLETFSNCPFHIKKSW